MFAWYRLGMDSKSRRTVSQNLPMRDFEAVGVVLDALGDPTRRDIVKRLGDGPLPVVEIARGLPVSRPAVSQHLKVLKDAGLVVDRKLGTRRLYELHATGATALRSYLDRFWNVGLAAFKSAAEQGSDTK